jgi:hypothetical protein
LTTQLCTPSLRAVWTLLLRLALPVFVLCSATSGHAQPARTGRPPLRVSLAPDSDRKDVTLYVDRGVNPILGPSGSTGANAFEPLCRPPCEFDLRNGTYCFGIMLDRPIRGTWSLIKVRPELTVQRGDQLVIRHRSRLATRIVGWVALLAVTSGGVWLASTGQEAGEPKEPLRIAGGTLLSILGVGGGIALAILPDRVTGRVQR